MADYLDTKSLDVKPYQCYSFDLKILDLKREEPEMFLYDAKFASIAADDRVETLRKSFSTSRVGRDPYRWLRGSRDADPAQLRAGARRRSLRVPRALRRRSIDRPRHACAARPAAAPPRHRGARSAARARRTARHLAPGEGDRAQHHPPDLAASSLRALGAADRRQPRPARDGRAAPARAARAESGRAGAAVPLDRPRAAARAADLLGRQATRARARPRPVVDGRRLPAGARAHRAGARRRPRVDQALLAGERQARRDRRDRGAARALRRVGRPRERLLARRARARAHPVSCRGLDSPPWQWTSGDWPSSAPARSASR